MTTNDDALIEAMADAIGDVWDCQEEDDDRLRVYARAALAVARKAILEEAATVADRHRSKIDVNEPLWHDGADWACDRIAEALRALADKETKP